MICRNPLFRASSALLFVIVIAPTIGGCSESWREEVLLSDGRVIVIDRERIREAGGDEWASNRSGTKPKEDRIRFANPSGSGKPIEWRTIKKDPATWPEVPLVFDIASGQPIIFSLVGISPGCSIYSQYVYQDGTWAEKPLSEQFDPRTTNLLFGNRKNLPGLVDLKEKRERNHFIGVRSRYKQVGPSREVCGY